MERGEWKQGAGELLWRSWPNDEHVVFHTASGNTHILNDFAAEVLRALSAAPASLTVIGQRIADTNGYELDSQLFEQTQAVLKEFKVLGLAESVP